MSIGAAAAKILITLAKSKQGRGLIKKILCAILIIIAVLLTGIMSIGNSVNNANNDIASRVFAGENIEDMSFDADPEVVQEIKDKLGGIQEEFSDIDSSVAYVNETQIVGDKLDANWVKSVYYAICLERKINFYSSSFISCFCKDVHGEGIIKEVKKDKKVLFENIGEMINYEITDTIKNTAEEIYMNFNK